MPRTKKLHPVVQKIFAAQMMLFLNAAAWLAFGVYIVVDMVRFNNGLFTISLIGLFFLINAAAMVFGAAMMGKREDWAYYFTLIVIFANAVFTRFGQFELFDLLAFIFDVMIFLFILSFRKAYFQGL
jgi:hypothetical protein